MRLGLALSLGFHMIYVTLARFQAYHPFSKIGHAVLCYPYTSLLIEYPLVAEGTTFRDLIQMARPIARV